MIVANPVVDIEP
jgi:26S proteasome regulatory subunit N7